MNQSYEANGTDYVLQIQKIQQTPSHLSVFRVIEQGLDITLNPQFQLPAWNPLNPHTLLHKYTTESVLSTETLAQFGQLGLRSHIRDVQLFLTQGPYVGALHTDGIDPTYIEGAVNWVYRETASSQWRFEYWRPRDPSAYSNSMKTDVIAGPGSARYPSEDTCEYMTSWSGPCSRPTLVRVNVPHRIIVEQEAPRFLFSIRFHVDQVNYWDLDRLLPQ
jgi:hypothetical protein